MPQANDIITMENLHAIAGEEWMKILREEVGDAAPATIADIRQMVRDAMRESPPPPAAAAPVRLSQTDISAIAREVAAILRDSPPNGRAAAA